MTATTPLPTDATAAPTPAATSTRPRPPARFGTILWGLLVIAFAAVVAIGTDLIPIEDPTAWLIGGLIVGGVALVGTGIAASLRRAR